MKTINLICRNCKISFEYIEKDYRREIRTYNRKPNEFYCSRSCSAKWRSKNDPSMHNFGKIPKEELQEIIKKRKRPTTNNKGEFDFLKYILSSIKKRKHFHDIDIEYLKELWQNQDGKCAISGIPLVLCKNKIEKNKPDTASLDRIDSNQGYIKDNVQFLAYSLNLAKNSFTNEEFLAFYNSLP